MAAMYIKVFILFFEGHTFGADLASLWLQLSDRWASGCFSFYGFGALFFPFPLSLKFNCL
jgi:hypothetical protein